MKKIMFNDRYGLTQAVLRRRKTMTRRLISKLSVEDEKYLDEAFDWDLREQVIIDRYAKYRVGEVVAVAQSYKNLGYTKEWVEQHVSPNPNAKWNDPFERKYPGWSNKMFVSANFMPHRIRINNILIERLQGISDEECLKEGIQEYFPYIDRDPNDKVRTFRYFKDGKIRHCISPASKCFAYLIDDVSGNGTWESNPYVLVYKFELV